MTKLQKRFINVKTCVRVKLTRECRRTHVKNEPNLCPTTHTHICGLQIFVLLLCSPRNIQLRAPPNEIPLNVTQVVA